MNTIRVASLAIIVLFGGYQARAQFYAPETEFHDKAQRLFPVELVRVLAWRENLQSAQIVEITYKTAVDEKRLTRWDLQCLDQNGKTLHQIKVSYPETLLQEGPRFYREVFKQVWQQGKWKAPATLSPDELRIRFWQGAEESGMAREEGLRAAFKLTGTVPSNPEEQFIPTVAGLSTHICLPSLCGGLTLDAMLLSRGAAWLCLAESALKSTSSAPDELWSPTLFMSGREIAAIELWQKSTQTGAKSERQPTLYAWWDFFLSRPKARDVFLFAADARQRPYAMPMLTYYSRIEGLGLTLAEVLDPLYGTPSKTFYRLHNYGPFFANATGVGGGRILEGAWPMLWRKEWVGMMRQFSGSSSDYSGYAEKLKELSGQVIDRPAGEDDASLVGLKAVAPLLQLGYEQGEGKLIPVAATT